MASFSYLALLAANATQTASSLHSAMASNATASNGAPFTEPMGQFGWSSYFQAIAAVFLLLGALILGFYLLRRYGPKAGFKVFGHGELKVEGQLALGPKRSVVLVRFLNKRLLLGVTESSITKLSEIETGQDNDTTSFENTLQDSQSTDDSP